MQLEKLEDLYSNEEACAKSAGLKYTFDDEPGISRKKKGKGFVYKDQKGKTVKESTLDKQFELVTIPPAWTDVWIAKNPKAHLLVTGYDDKGRKQYLYHPKWREIRDLTNFYRLIKFGEVLPKIRKKLIEHLDDNGVHRRKALSTVIAILDQTFIRIGNQVYANTNKSFGLTTLKEKHTEIHGSEIELRFIGKSGKKQDIIIDNLRLAHNITEMIKLPGNNIFEYEDEDGEVKTISSNDINEYLKNISGADISAKEFRTWGGTLTAYDFARDWVKDNPSKASSGSKLPLNKMYQAASEKLGNTPAMCRDHYIHPHLIQAIKENSFEGYLEKLPQVKATKNLHKDEAELLEFLKLLFTKIK